MKKILRALSNDLGRGSSFPRKQESMIKQLGKSRQMDTRMRGYDSRRLCCCQLKVEALFPSYEPKGLIMRENLIKHSGIAVCLGVIASMSLQSNPVAAAPVKPQSQAQIFTPACAARPRCMIHVCARNGRCSVGKQLHTAGCLYYTCKIAPR
jgi:hypothetical protein